MSASASLSPSNRMPQCVSDCIQSQSRAACQVRLGQFLVAATLPYKSATGSAQNIGSSQQYCNITHVGIERFMLFPLLSGSSPLLAAASHLVQSCLLHCVCGNHCRGSPLEKKDHLFTTTITHSACSYSITINTCIIMILLTNVYLRHITFIMSVGKPQAHSSVLTLPERYSPWALSF